MELMGVYDEALVEPLARVLANLGVKRRWSYMDRTVWMRFP